MQEYVVVERYRRLMIVRCRGNLDLASRSRLEPAISGLPTPDVDSIIVDLSAVSFLDCTALSVLLSLARRCARAEVGLIFAEPTPIVRRLLTALDLDNALTLVSRFVDAMALARRWAAEGCDGTPRARVWLLPPPQRLPSPAGGED